MTRVAYELVSVLRSQRTLEQVQMSEPRLKPARAPGFAGAPGSGPTSHVRITVFCSAVVIDVMVHCHTAGAL